MTRDIFVSTSPKETEDFAAMFAGTLQPGDIVALRGELGSGKTTFVQGLARGLGIEENVNSPTFKIVSEFEGRLTLYHIDFYRIDNAHDLLKIGFEEYLQRDGVTAIEWADRLPEAIPNGAITVDFFAGDLETNERRIVIEKNE